MHRDIKPANFFVTHAGEEYDFLKLLDFGVARVVEGDQPSLTETGILFGTPAYMSPEVCSGERASTRSDIYSLGAVLYFMLTGTPLFPDRTFAETVMSHISKTPELPSVRLGKPLPEGLEMAVMRVPAEAAGRPLPQRARARRCARGDPGPRRVDPRGRAHVVDRRARERGDARPRAAWRAACPRALRSSGAVQHVADEERAHLAMNSLVCRVLRIACTRCESGWSSRADEADDELVVARVEPVAREANVVRQLLRAVRHANLRVLAQDRRSGRAARAARTPRCAAAGTRRARGTPRCVTFSIERRRSACSRSGSWPVAYVRPIIA